jgi:hypothetical protein
VGRIGLFVGVRPVVGCGVLDAALAVALALHGLVRGEGVMGPSKRPESGWDSRRGSIWETLPSLLAGTAGPPRSGSRSRIPPSA